MIKVAVIGASFARAAYLPAFHHISEADVIAIASGRRQSAEATAEEFGIASAYDDWQAMLDKEKPDLVCIATPTVFHAPMTLKALAIGAHVLCEKPMAMNAEECEAMWDAARKSGRLNMIDHELRFNPNRMRIADMIANGDLGEIRHVNITNIGASWNDPSSRSKNDWWSLAEMGGGRLGANGSHQVDMLRWWLGDVDTVTGQALTMVPDRVDPKSGDAWRATADDLAILTLRMGCGALAQVFMSGVAANNMGNHTQIFGSKGTITLSNADERLYFARAGETFTDVTVEDPNKNLEGLNAGIWNVSTFSALREFVTAIIEGRQLQRGATFEDGLRTQKVLDAVLVSTAQRRTVDLRDGASN